MVRSLDSHPESDSLRDQARTWYEEHWDPELTVGDWYRRMSDSGWGYPGWPADRFGRGLDKDEVRIVREQRREVGALPPPSGIGPTLLAPMLFEHGNDDQKQRFLSGMANGEIIVCQMLSEPSAGSDLAGVRTRAERDGDEWRITGQKVWTSNAQVVDYGMLLARTNMDVPKHRGLGFFLDPSRSARHRDPSAARNDRRRALQRGLLRRCVGARRRCAGRHRPRVGCGPDVLGAREELAEPVVSRGWHLRPGRSRRESSATSCGPSIEEVGHGSRSETDARRTLGRPPRHRRMPILRQDMARLHSLQETLRATNLRVKATKAQGGRPGREAAISKLVVSETTRSQRELGLALQGPHGMLMDDPFQDFALGSPAISIAGGTDEIQKNHLGERVLGLPAEQRTDTNVAFKDHP